MFQKYSVCARFCKNLNYKILVYIFWNFVISISAKNIVLAGIKVWYESLFFCYTKLYMLNAWSSAIDFLTFVILSSALIHRFFSLQSLTLCDDKVSTFHDLGSQFFLREEDVKNSVNRLAVDFFFNQKEMIKNAVTFESSRHDFDPKYSKIWIYYFGFLSNIYASNWFNLYTTSFLIVH